MVLRRPKVSSPGVGYARVNSVEDERNKVKVKIEKVLMYWNKSSLLVPNVFRMLTLLDDDNKNFLEYQDLSRKELLVQSNGQKAKVHSCEDLGEGSDDESESKTRHKNGTQPSSNGASKKLKKQKTASMQILAHRQ
jgi:hypothetical protein